MCGVWWRFFFSDIRRARVAARVCAREPVSARPARSGRNHNNCRLRTRLAAARIVCYRALSGERIRDPNTPSWALGGADRRPARTCSGTGARLRHAGLARGRLNGCYPAPGMPVWHSGVTAPKSWALRGVNVSTPVTARPRTVTKNNSAWWRRGQRVSQRGSQRVGGPAWQRGVLACPPPFPEPSAPLAPIRRHSVGDSATHGQDAVTHVEWNLVEEAPGAGRGCARRE